MVWKKKLKRAENRKTVSEAALRIPFSLLGQLGKVDVLVARHGESKAALRLRAIGLKKVSMQKLEPSAESKQDITRCKRCSMVLENSPRGGKKLKVQTGWYPQNRAMSNKT